MNSALLARRYEEPKNKDINKIMKNIYKNWDEKMYFKYLKDFKLPENKISKEFYYLGRMNATGKAKEFIMPNTNKSAVEIEWILETPVREDIYEYIIN